MGEGDQSEGENIRRINALLDRFSKWVCEYCEEDLAQSINRIEVTGTDIKIVILKDKKEYHVPVVGDQLDVTDLASFLRKPR